MSHLTQLVRGAAVGAALALSASLGGAQELARPVTELVATPAVVTDSTGLGAAATPVLSPATESAAPALAATSVGVRSRTLTAASVVEREAAAAQAARAGFTQSQVLMILGGATFLTGAIIGDDAGTIVMLGGAAVGLYGLYLYLQSN